MRACAGVYAQVGVLRTTQKDDEGQSMKLNCEHAKVDHTKVDHAKVDHTHPPTCEHTTRKC